MSGDPVLGWAPVGLLPCLMRTEVFSPWGCPAVCEVVFTLSVCLGCEPCVCSSVPLVPQGRAWALPTQEGCSEEGVQGWRGGRQGPGRLL